MIRYHRVFVRHRLSTFHYEWDNLLLGHHQPLRTWIMCLYLMGLNLSSLQIANELDLNRNDVKNMVDQLRKGIVDAQPVVQLEGEVELDEVYMVAGHKGNPEAVKKKGESDAADD